MSNLLKNLVNEARSRGYVCSIKPRLKQIKMHGYKKLSFDEAELYLKDLLKVLK
jgi:chaperonin GroEL (HSP60 family)